MVNFDEQPPAATDGIDTWKLIKTEEAFIMGCNGVELLELRFAYAGCATNWAGDAVTEFSFNPDHDTGPTETSKQPIRTRYLGHVTGYKPIRYEYSVWRRDPI
eukprot:sb/3478273/